MMFSTLMFHIRQLRKDDLEQVEIFTNREIGAGYFSRTELEDILERSTVDDTTFSLILEKQLPTGAREIHGVRITLPPGRWSRGKGKGLQTQHWKIDPVHVAYFQSLFLSREVQGKGFGVKLSLNAIELLRNSGARAIATHAWKESPHNSSLKYLEKLGFKAVIEYPEYWIDVNYVCPRDGNPCRCTAVEMLLVI